MPLAGHCVGDLTTEALMGTGSPASAPVLPNMDAHKESNNFTKHHAPPTPLGRTAFPPPDMNSNARSLSLT